MGEPRRCACCGDVVSRPNGDPWTGRLDAYCEECATTRCDAFPGDCRRLSPGRVPVIEAMLTDELVEKVARAVYEERTRHSTVAAPWEHLGEGHGGSKWETRIDARAALRAAGFQGPGGTDGQ